MGVKKIISVFIMFLIMVAVAYCEENDNFTHISIIEIPEFAKTTKCPSSIRDQFNEIQEDLKSFQKANIKMTIERYVRKNEKSWKSGDRISYAYVNTRKTKHGFSYIQYILGKKGKIFLFDSTGKLKEYCEGDIEKVLPEGSGKFTINGTGAKIQFFANGFPASYQTVVKNRLYGRQIEWNDKGEVVSDVDLDIPQEWKDAPKKIDPNKSEQ
jgi:hypothetical protein